MKLRIPLIIKVLLPLQVIIIATLIFAGLSFYRETNQRWQREMDTRLARVVELIARELDPALLSQIDAPADLYTEAYTTLQKQLAQAQTAANVGFIGILRRDIKTHRLYYWVDVDNTGINYPFFYDTPEHWAAFEDGQRHAVRYADEFGSYYGLVAPIVVNDAQGQPYVIAIVEASLSVEARDLTQQSLINQLLPLIIGGSLVAIACAWLATVFVVNRPLQRLKHGALQLADGHLGHTLPDDQRVTDELTDLTRTFNLMSQRIAKLYTEQSERERMLSELQIARNVQQALLPKRLPSVAGLEVAAICLPQRETSGDFYGVIAQGSSTVDLMIGDVSGKSVPAALVMVATYSTLRALAGTQATPAMILDQTNTSLVQNIPRSMFAAVSYARIDALARTLVWANAGQVYPFLIHSSRNQPEFPEYLTGRGQSLPLGITPLIQYEDSPIQCNHGDMLLFFTDGIVEAMNSSDEMYGFERLEDLVRSLPADIHAQALLDAVLNDVQDFANHTEQHDDITMLAVKFV
ncbi:MAG TPA: HAMP domain-containing protein [Herpetosiphon sp.]|uniref:Protein serine/threonine phosphatase n=1 Tax=Herpetosiphon aurantiacus (strain ATCC 23779 / DSM 785 / 114-95) TaxID=316274 RepID=A9B3I1_HERA2|nr:PP2C family protein-serine/threonine phosphatase [Herpetosiphon sp.]ABX05553.1 protein serine/threonine phosphatase [Herpetosiphon aurantiacus DSM 785]HBW52099.1 HAMP domain-containing protein [Herpetosiphon sp.]